MCFLPRMRLVIAKRETFAKSGITPVQFGILLSLQLDGSAINAF